MYFMKKGNFYWSLFLLIPVTGILYNVGFNFKPDKVSYVNDVKPILNKHCLSCHGGVKKQGKFSLLFKEEALAVSASGKASIVPFHPEKSSFISRLHEKDPEEKMPYKRES